MVGEVTSVTFGTDTLLRFAGKHDVIINEEDCGTLRGLVCTEIKNNEEVVASLSERILGRVSVHDIVDPYNPEEIIVHAGEEITEAIADRIEKSPIESVEIRSVLTCESKKGVCAKCYGRNLSNHRMVLCRQDRVAFRNPLR